MNNRKYTRWAEKYFAKIKLNREISSDRDFTWSLERERKENEEARHRAIEDFPTEFSLASSEDEKLALIKDANDIGIAKECLVAAKTGHVWHKLYQEKNVALMSKISQLVDITTGELNRVSRDVNLKDEIFFEISAGTAKKLQEKIDIAKQVRLDLHYLLYKEHYDEEYSVLEYLTLPNRREIQEKFEILLQVLEMNILAGLTSTAGSLKITESILYNVLRYYPTHLTLLKKIFELCPPRNINQIPVISTLVDSKECQNPLSIVLQSSRGSRHGDRDEYIESIKFLLSQNIRVDSSVVKAAINYCTNTASIAFLRILASSRDLESKYKAELTKQILHLEKIEQ